MTGYEGEWRAVKATSTARGPMGGLAVVVTWEEGGTARFPAGDELLIRQPEPPTTDAPWTTPRAPSQLSREGAQLYALTCTSWNPRALPWPSVAFYAGTMIRNGRAAAGGAAREPPED